jgi:asparagine synthase (glutamine-hydrolysing)
MCGIAAVSKSSDDGIVTEMMKRIAHRGPDSEGLYRDPDGRGVLGHRRLSIVDPAGGDQPLLSDRPRSAAVVNGEIYNHQEIREMLHDAHFQSGSDSESILQLYLEVDQEAVRRLHGMFAFVVQDGDDLFVGRDALGIKPLYMGRRGSSWCFASEIKALVGIAEGIREFPPGSTFHTTRGFRRFYSVPELEQESFSPLEASARLREALERAVIRRLMSDVPVGVFLSGGLDSSVVAAIARQHIDPLHSFAVGTAGSEDLLAARRVASYLGTTHHEYVLTAEDILEHLPHILYHLESFDQDLVRNGIPCYFAARRAAEHVKVVLTGEGADELFAGYRYHKRYLDVEELQRELRRCICRLHNINLQRLDRLTMAHGVEGRVPFLDLEIVSLAQRLEPRLKLHGEGRDRVVEKWLLRRACEDLLPDEIVWRDKQQFDEGSGTVSLLPGALDQWADLLSPGEYLRANSDTYLRSPEECVYHALLVATYPDPEPVLSNVARWSDLPANPGGPVVPGWGNET